MKRTVYILVGETESHKAAGYWTPTMIGDSIEAKGYHPRVDIERVVRFVFFDESCENWLLRDQTLWRECFPSDFSLMKLAAGWPALGCANSSSNKEIRITDVFAPCREEAVIDAIFEGVSGAIWALDLLGGVRWDGCFPTYTECFFTDILDSGISAIMLGSEGYVDRCVRGAREHYTQLGFEVIEGSPAQFPEAVLGHGPKYCYGSCLPNEMYERK